LVAFAEAQPCNCDTQKRETRSRCFKGIARGAEGAMTQQTVAHSPRLDTMIRANTDAAFCSAFAKVFEWLWEVFEWLWEVFEWSILDECRA
jgi:hypothetical protein